MLKIGEFSKLSHITIKALRYYENEGILVPIEIDKYTGYRYYETSQLLLASKIKAYRQIGLGIEEIKDICSGADAKDIISRHEKNLIKEKQDIENHLSIIKYILEDDIMNYQVTEKIIDEKIVFSSETVLKDYSDIMTWIPSLGEECMKLNPTLKCSIPEYEFCEYLDCEYKEHDIRIRHNQAVEKAGVENDIIKFRTLPKAKVLSIYHKGPYELLHEAYSFIFKYAEQNNYKINGYVRESYIDGIWNKEDPEEWLTEIQLPIE